MMHFLGEIRFTKKISYQVLNVSVAIGTDLGTHMDIDKDIELETDTDV